MYAAAQNDILAVFDRFLRGTDWIIGKLVVLSMILMVAVVAAQVVLRYGFNLSLDWAEESSRFFFVWSIFLAVPLGIRRGAHVAIALLTDHFPARLQDTLFRLMNGLAVLLMGVVAYEAAVLTADQWDEPMATLDFSVGLFMLPLFIGAVHSILHLANGILNGPPEKATVVAE